MIAKLFSNHISVHTSVIIHPVSQNLSKSKIILYWTLKNGKEDWGWDFGLGHKCGGKCICTSNRDYLPEADTVMLSLPNSNINLNDLPKRQNTDQIFAAVIYETPHSYGVGNVYNLLSDARLRNFFNMTVTYRHDSDVVVRYYDFIPIHQNETTAVVPAKKPKRKQAAWIVSHCNTFIKREQFVKALQKYINITIYGSCGRRISHICPRYTADCLRDSVKDYKFYIAFENTLCDDYLTEKGPQFMSLPIIPVVMSFGNPDKYFPPKSFINVFDFKSVASLAQYILYLDHNDTAYSEYLTWKDRWKVRDHLKTRPEVICNVCSLMYTDFEQSYTNLADWFARPGICKEDGLSGLFSDFQLW